jgi:NADPH-dependent curcumin reductase CurA
MSAARARQIVLAARPQGRPKLTDFRLEETAIPTPGPRQVLLRVQYLSLDPNMRGRMDDRESYAMPTPLGGVMPGESVGTVVASQNPAYPKGETVAAQTGWRTHATQSGTPK